MSSLGSPNPFFIAGKKAYEIERSLRFDNVQIPLKRTPSSSSNKKTMTFSLWFKRAVDTNFNSFFIAYGNASNRHGLDFISGGQLRLWGNYNGSVAMTVQPTQVFRDFSAWYHFVCAIDTTQGTASNRVKMYVNGTQITDFATASYPSQNFEFAFNDQNAETQMGSYSKLYLAEIHEIDGFAYDPSYFGETDPITGQWNPKKYTGSYGTNGFYLNFSDNSSTSALGTDSSGNSNNFTVTNLSVSAGAGNSSLEDSPTNNFPTINPLDGGTNALLTNGNLTFKPNSSNSGNFNVFYSTFSMRSGKWYFEVLIVNENSGSNSIQFGIGSYKYKRDSTNQNGNVTGLTLINTNNSNSAYRKGVVDGSTVGSSVSTSSTNDVYGVAFDADNKKVYFYKNGSAEGESSGYNVTDVGTGDFFFFSTLRYSTGGSYSGGDSTLAVNFGQRAFSYTAPTGYKKLCSANLPDPTILLPNKHFDTLLWTGDASYPRVITGLQFQPDWHWTKTRNQSYGHGMYDSVRGTGSSKALRPDDAGSEGDASIAPYIDLSSFNSNGVTYADPSDAIDIGNGNGYTIVGWNWNAGDTDGKTYTVTVVDDSGNKYRFDGFGTSAVTLDLAEGGTYIFNYPSAHPFRFSTTADGTHGGGSEYTTGVTHNSSTQVTIVVAASAPTLYYYCSSHSGMGGQVNTNSTLGSSNFDGAIQTTAKVNASAGFSIVTYTGSGSTTTAGHGLGVAPVISIRKARNATLDWFVHHTLVDGSMDFLKLNTTDSNSNSSLSAFTSTVFPVDDNTNQYIIYCFSEVAGYSKFGSYTGNGSTDGTFVFTGFRPAWVMIKRTSPNGYSWVLVDNKRDTFNVTDKGLIPNLSDAEGTGYSMDFFSNGFKLRLTGTAMNASGATYIYLCFAESPFKNARAR